VCFFLYTDRLVHAETSADENEVAELRTRTYLLLLVGQEACNSLYDVHLLLFPCKCTYEGTFSSDRYGLLVHRGAG